MAILGRKWAFAGQPRYYERGGLCPMANVFGSSAAEAKMIGSIMIPEMKRQGYRPRLAPSTVGDHRPDHSETVKYAMSFLAILTVYLLILVFLPAISATLMQLLR